MLAVLPDVVTDVITSCTDEVRERRVHQLRYVFDSLDNFQLCSQKDAIQYIFLELDKHWFDSPHSDTDE